MFEQDHYNYLPISGNQNQKNSFSAPNEPTDEMEEGENRVANVQSHPATEPLHDQELGEFIDDSTVHTNGRKRQRQASSSSELTTYSVESSHKSLKQQNQNHQNQQSTVMTSQKPASSSSFFMYNKSSFCNLCKRQFYSKCFLKNHLARIHGITLDDDELDQDEDANDQSEMAANKRIFINKLHLKSSANNLLKKSIYKKKHQPAFNHIFSGSMSSGPATMMMPNSSIRVRCNICNKELCNKYFLKQHVTNSHKLTFNDYLLKYEHGQSGDVDPRTLALSGTSFFSRSLIPSESQHSNTKSEPVLGNSNKYVISNQRQNDRVMGPRPTKFKRYVLLKKNKKLLVRSIFKKKQSDEKTSQNDADVDTKDDALDAYKKLYGGELADKLRPFWIESSQGEKNGMLNAPCLVYLPWSGKDLAQDGEITISVKLRPVQQNVNSNHDHDRESSSAINC
jgi:hypothetical protein